jgi:AcrR family transcriptional regulator
MARAGLSAERVTLAAADLADEIGLENVTIAALARGFGVKDPSLYSHVKNLTELRTRVVALATAEFADALGEAVAGRSGYTALTAFADAYREFATRQPGRYAASQLPVVTDGGARIVATCSALLRGYALDEPEATDAVRLVRSTLHGWASLESSGAFQAARDVETSWQAALSGLDRLLSDWPGNGPVHAHTGTAMEAGMTTPT